VRTGAEFLGVANRVGTMTEDKQADLVLIDGRPDEEIESVRGTAGRVGPDSAVQIEPGHPETA